MIVKSNVKTELRKKWIISHKKEKKASKPVSMLGQKNFFLKPGQYNIDLYIQDVNDSTSYNNYLFDIIIRDFNNDIFISQPEFAQVVQSINNIKGNWNRSFLKSDYLVVPHPPLIFNSSNQELNSYIEIYAKDNKRGTTQINEYELVNNLNQTVIQDMITKQLSEFKTVYFCSIPLVNIPSGSYRLNIKSFNQNSSDTVYFEKKVFILNPNKIKNKPARTPATPLIKGVKAIIDPNRPNAAPMIV